MERNYTTDIISKKSGLKPKEFDKLIVAFNK